MPELPDVETFRRFLNRTAIGQPIEKIDVDELIHYNVWRISLQ
jgi:formamidopyrimidine-DNA glycosylase